MRIVVTCLVHMLALGPGFIPLMNCNDKQNGWSWVWVVWVNVQKACSFDGNYFRRLTLTSVSCKWKRTHSLTNTTSMHLFTNTPHRIKQDMPNSDAYNPMPPKGSTVTSRYQVFYKHGDIYIVWKSRVSFFFTKALILIPTRKLELCWTSDWSSKDIHLSYHLSVFLSQQGSPEEAPFPCDHRREHCEDHIRLWRFVHYFRSLGDYWKPDGYSCQVETLTISLECTCGRCMSFSKMPYSLVL